MMAETASRPDPPTVTEVREEKDSELLSYDDEVEQDLETFADALAGLPD